MKRIALASALLAMGAIPAFAADQFPPVPTNVGGIRPAVSGIQTGVNQQIGAVRSIPIFSGIGNAELLQKKSNDFLDSVKPAQ